MAQRGSVVLQVLTAASLAASLGVVGCGSDGGAAAGGSTPAAASGTSPSGMSASSGPTTTDGPTWRDYFALRIGRECTTGVGGRAGQRTTFASRTRVTDVADNGKSVAFTVQATPLSDDDGEDGRPVTLPYRIDPDGTMRVTPTVQDTGLVRVRVNGFELYPSLADLADGRSQTSTIAVMTEGETSAARKLLAKDLRPGETAPELEIELSVGPAPAKSSLATPGGRFSDLVGVHTRATSARYTNLKPGAAASSAPAIAAIRKAFTSTTYFARQTGPVQTEAFGKTLRLQGCNG